MVFSIESAGGIGKLKAKLQLDAKKKEEEEERKKKEDDWEKAPPTAAVSGQRQSQNGNKLEPGSNKLNLCIRFTAPRSLKDSKNNMYSSRIRKTSLFGLDFSQYLRTLADAKET
jgi:hypothetical protein